MKKRDSVEPLFVIIFTLLPKEKAGSGNEKSDEKKDEAKEDDELD